MNVLVIKKAVILISIILASTIAFIAKDVFFPHIDINIDPVWKIIIAAILISASLYLGKMLRARAKR